MLEKKDEEPKLYVGSGTSTYNGVSARIGDYDRNKVIPRRVAEALKKGYTITHMGLLCWSPISPADLVPIRRVLFTALEATLTFVFWALHGNTDRYGGMSHICPWDLDSLQYQGLCSHSALRELPPGDHDLDAEELKAQALEIARLRRPRLNENTRRCVEKAKIDDPAKYAAQMAQRSKWRRKTIQKR